MTKTTIRTILEAAAFLCGLAFLGMFASLMVAWDRELSMHTLLMLAAVIIFEVAAGRYYDR